jgi:hypothetical protein
VQAIPVTKRVSVVSRPALGHEQGIMQTVLSRRTLGSQRLSAKSHAAL